MKDFFKDALVIGSTTLVAGYSLKCALQRLDIKTSDPVIYFGAGILAYMLRRAFSSGLSSSLGSLPEPVGAHTDETDPDLNVLSNIENYIHPNVKSFKAKEIGPKNSSIYLIKFLKPEYCDALVRVVEKYGDWDSYSKGGYGKGMTLPLEFMPTLEKQYSDALKKYLYPMARILFPTFEPTHHDRPYILRYRTDRDKQQKMDAHYDGEPMACILTLNRNFKGGGTFFPKWNYTALAKPGEIIVYPGGLSHLHGGKKITKGRRYAILNALYDRELNGEGTTPWEAGEPTPHFKRKE